MFFFRSKNTDVFFFNSASLTLLTFSFVFFFLYIRRLSLRLLVSVV